jgi:hypothetical protein
LGLSQGIEEGRSCRPVAGATGHADDLARRVDQVAHRDAGGAIGGADLAVAIPEDRQGEIVLVDKRFHWITLAVDGHREHCQSVIAMAPMEPFQCRHLAAAGPTPGGEEGEHHPVPMAGRQIALATAEERQREIGRRRRRCDRLDALRSEYLDQRRRRRCVCRRYCRQQQAEQRERVDERSVSSQM